MKVLIVSSSPRKEGNSDVLCDRFARGASEAGHEVEKIMLRDKKISPCNACYACMETHTCVIKDDMADIFPKLLKADVILLASPVYFYSVSAQMKAVIDRCLVDHKRIAGKKFYFIVTAADPQHEAAEGTLAAFRGFIRCLPDSQERGVIYGTGTWDKGDVFRHPSYEQAYKMGKEM
ncbi:MAG: flavodoxin family protein [Lachnospiraceae bacterium]|nr:flavodoxin family protein [Lachnospiraceae bacterium]